MDIKTSDLYKGDNVNFFDIEHEFFFIDSEHLNDVKTRMYGFSVQETGIFEEVNMTDKAASGLDGCGIYVYVERTGKDNEIIRICQDYNGSYGLYFYSNGNYFAISNSFFVLLDHLKLRFPLTLNRDFANHILLDSLSSYAYSETSVNEISLLPKNAIFEIDIESSTYHINFIDYKDDSYVVDTADGIAILDKWFKKWTTVFRNIKSHTDQIIVNLSGGFDSRVTFMLMLKSGIDLNEILVSSIKDDLHTHTEDYKIASEIAEQYGFILNDKKFSGKAIHYSLEDIINIAFYTKMTFHKEMYFKHHRFAEKRYVVPGSGGESIRSFWDESAEEFEEKNKKRAQRYSADIANEMGESVHRILNFAYQAIGEKYNIEDKNSSKYPWYLHREARDRSHFGKNMVEDLFANSYTLTPMIDPDLRKIKLSDTDCTDNDLLIALIFTRYCPSLLEFPFEGNRKIDSKTIKTAKKINEKFPVSKDIFSTETDNDFDIVIEDQDVIDKINAGIVNRAVPRGIPDKYLMDVFDSTGCRKLFATYFDEEIYSYAKINAEKSKYFPLRECYVVLGLMRVIESIMEGACIQKPAMIDTMDRLVNMDYYQPYDPDELIQRLKNYITARIDILFKGSSAGGELIENSDHRASITNPEWFQKDGKGYVIESNKGEIDLAFKALNDGEVCIYLRGRDVRDENGKKIPYWIDYKNVIYDEESQFDGVKQVWHDRPFIKTIRVKKDDTITLHMEWTPHQKESLDEQHIDKSKRHFYRRS